MPIDKDQYKLEALGLTGELRDQVAALINEVKTGVTDVCAAHSMIRVADVLEALAITDETERQYAVLRVVGHGHALDHEARGWAA